MSNSCFWPGLWFWCIESTNFAQGEQMNKVTEKPISLEVLCMCVCLSAFILPGQRPKCITGCCGSSIYLQNKSELLPYFSHLRKSYWVPGSVWIECWRQKVTCREHMSIFLVSGVRLFYFLYSPSSKPMMQWDALVQNRSELYWHFNVQEWENCLLNLPGQGLCFKY